MGTVQLIPRCELYTRKYGSYIISQRWFILKLRVIDTSCARASQIIHCWTCTHLLRQHTFFIHVCSCLLASFDHSGPKLTSSEISAAEENYKSSTLICRWKWFSKAPVPSVCASFYTVFTHCNKRSAPAFQYIEQLSGPSGYFARATLLSQ